MRKPYQLQIILFLFAISFSSHAQNINNPSDELKIASVFGSHMVLQREVPIHVWGEARPGTKIVAQLGKEKCKTSADVNGEWLLSFKARKASFDPISLNVNDVSFHNILIGEVWVCSGQSNMYFALKNIDTFKSISEQLCNENLRLFQHTNIRIVAKQGYSEEELARCNPQDFFQAQWAASRAETAENFSAIAWLFGHGLQQKLEVPVGIVQLAVGGSALNNWIPPQALKVNTTTASLFEKDWLENDQVKLAHRQRARDAFQNVLTPGESYLAGQFPYRWLCEPGFLFEAGIAPLKHLPFRGVLWYQGESDTDNPQMVEAAKELFPMLVNEWRTFFKAEDLPFIFVQLPGFGNETWPAFRDLQYQAQQKLSNTSMVVSIDLGDEKNIHPKDKQPIGERAVLQALKNVYGFKGLTDFPQLEKWSMDSNGISLAFSECGEGLQSSADTIPGFEISGEDGIFKKAKANLSSGTTLFLESPVENPSCLRYGWMPFPNPPLTLYNSEHLPLGPFRIVLKN